MKFASRAKFAVLSFLFERTGAVSVSKPFSVDEIRRLVPLHSCQSREVSAEAEVALRS
jgi:hypothetical protein